MKTHVRMDVGEMGVLSKSKLLQLQIAKCESSIDDDDAAADKVDDSHLRLMLLTLMMLMLQMLLKMML